MSEGLILERYRRVEAAPARLGGAASLAEDTAEGDRLVEVHVLPGTPEAEAAFPAVRQAIEALRAAPPGPLARPLDLAWGPDGELVLAQEYHEGRSLADLQAAAPLAPERAREVLRGVLHALAVARRLGLHHGGLSPRRVLVDPAADDRVVLLDLGVMSLAARDPADAAYRAPGDARGARADAHALAVLALELLTGARPAVGQPAPEPPPAAAQAVGPEFLRAVQALARADGSARADDAGALLGLLPARRRRTRRARFAVREAWDGDIGPGTARLLQLGLRPEFRDRMPAEIRGAAAVPAAEPAPVRFQTISVAPRPVAPEPAPAPAPVALAPTAPPPPLVVRVAPRPPTETSLFAGDAALTVPPPGGEVTQPLEAPARLPGPLVLRAGDAPTALFLLTPRDGALDLGRERGNDIILRAFRGPAIENVDSNRISRKHLYVQRRGDALLVACGQRDAPARASTYGTTLDGARLPVERRGAESVGAPTPLPVGRDFELVLALTSVRLVGRVAPGSLALRLARADGVEHEYVVVWPGAEATLGSGPDDALRLPAAGGVVPGHARLGLDMLRGGFQVTPHAGPVRAGGRDLPRGAWAPLDEGVVVGDTPLAARPAVDGDFLAVGASLAIPG